MRDQRIAMLAGSDIFRISGHHRRPSRLTILAPASPATLWPAAGGSPILLMTAFVTVSTYTRKIQSGTGYRWEERKAARQHKTLPHTGGAGRAVHVQAGAWTGGGVRQSRQSLGTRFVTRMPVSARASRPGTVLSSLFRRRQCVTVHSLARRVNDPRPAHANKMWQFLWVCGTGIDRLPFIVSDRS